MTTNEITFYEFMSGRVACRVYDSAPPGTESVGGEYFLNPDDNESIQFRAGTLLFRDVFLRMIELPRSLIRVGSRAQDPIRMNATLIAGKRLAALCRDHPATFVFDNVVYAPATPHENVGVLVPRGNRPIIALDPQTWLDTWALPDRRLLQSCVTAYMDINSRWDILLLG